MVIDLSAYNNDFKNSQPSVWHQVQHHEIKL